MSKLKRTYIDISKDSLLDPIHASFDLFGTPLIQDVWRDKYLYEGFNEKHPHEAMKRVANAIASAERTSEEQEIISEQFFTAMEAGLWIPAGRILAGAGTHKRVTLMNCFVNGTIEDDMESILKHHDYTMLTMQQGGGMGTDFSTIRPSGAVVRRTHSVSSGIIPFMKGWDRWCATIRSAGDRRGAMMGTLCDTHPDLPAFIVAKQEQGVLTNFNISILVSDAFIAAIEDDEKWLLYFDVPPKTRPEALVQYDFVDDSGKQQYVYSIWEARELWGMITRNTYEWSEPGVIFIDRVNDLNNLSYLETIRCTNPCGEQPLPPHATCNLGAVNLSRMVIDPYSAAATFNFQLLRKIVKLGVRFLDNVIDVTNYPLEEQAVEEFNKRRIGLGITGLADMLAQLRLRYNSIKGVQFAERVMQEIALAAYEESVDLAIERGAFPLIDIDAHMEAPFIKKLPQDLQARIRRNGIRNGVLLTIAPTGTTSIAFGNPSSGLEPTFRHEFMRNVRQFDGSFKAYTETSFGRRFYEHVNGSPELPEYMGVASDLTILDHIRLQGALQKWVDASVSKTINLDTDITYDEFVEVYTLAYQYGCKGCTTYRPSDVRGSILSTTTDAAGASNAAGSGRPEVLEGHTYRINWPSLSSSMYVTINYKDDLPYEMFFASKDARYADWMTALTLMISALLRKGVDPRFIPGELKQVISMHDTAWIDGKHYGSLVSRIGDVIEEDFKNHNIIKGLFEASKVVDDAPLSGAARISGPQIPGATTCPTCSAPTLIRKEGCNQCLNCGYSHCG